MDANMSAAAKESLDKVIQKARVHFYKPFQIAEVLYRDREVKDIDLSDLETYRTKSRKWRDEICNIFIGRSSTSSARYQDDVFNKNATPPEILVALGEINRNGNGIVEAYIYEMFRQKISQMSSSIGYLTTHNRNNFQLSEFIELFWSEPGLRRSIDKVYEIVVYSLFSTLVDYLKINIKVSIENKDKGVFQEFEDFAKRIINVPVDSVDFSFDAKIFRMGVTNAADRGLDMWANFGIAIQIKHLSLDEDLAIDIMSSTSSDRVIIVCKDADRTVVQMVVNQIGWASKVQDIVTEQDLVTWYAKALTGKYGADLGDIVLQRIKDEIEEEFPASKENELLTFFNTRGYSDLDISSFR